MRRKHANFFFSLVRSLILLPCKWWTGLTRGELQVESDTKYLSNKRIYISLLQSRLPALEQRDLNLREDVRYSPRI